MQAIQFITENVYLLALVAVGPLAGALGSAYNVARTWDEWFCGFVAGTAGALAVTAIGHAIGEAAGIPELRAFALIGFCAASTICAAIVRGFDALDHPVAASFSLLFKLPQSPLLTGFGLLIAIGFAIAGKASLRRGTVFLNLGGTRQGAITLGSVVWAYGGCFDAGGEVKDDLAKHEAYHTRQVTAFNELGFYPTYILLAAPWGAIEAGRPFGTENDGCGNPFEKTARTYNHAVKPTPSGKCECKKKNRSK